ncbi:hypothetical protein BX616_005166 [Lobosporangium transversale]|uniref:Extracellular membrane protein CFEM domain-containing protein n=1 Tax=Lobosporangium transversale TaxID=64571 RepID=A0A1Y2GG69_9FUNG|nr:hypothetical protein BCR41DRAFT_358044 [Lobosporangium transversale]KAF9915875.1 hypothetical protein BX616_005166 [Lobosporangium transversale]ORZ09985.1 hypothetical protein BCR41DRAFT_358044 [Lobosporangium transversale]|eukprot:XP_021879075.1 hypothetical protein BCR41DRAFT_358044 [Lobosporangium transversale]
MKNLFFLLSAVAVLLSPALADDVNSECVVHAFKPSWSAIKECCLSNMGGSDFRRNKLFCKLPTGNEGYFRRCVKKLGYASTVDCVY